MSWIGLSDTAGTAFRREGLGPLRAAPAQPQRYRDSRDNDILVRGTLMLEATHHGIADKKTTLIDCGDGANRLYASLYPDGALNVRFGDDPCRPATAFRTGTVADGRTFRLTISWDAAFGSGLASVEDIEGGTLTQTDLDSTVPIRTKDLMTLVERPLPAALQYLAVADTVEPVGLVPAFARDTPIDTPGGQRMVQHLRAGDLVLTADHGPQPVRWVGRREIPACGELMPIRLRAPYFGLSRDIIISADLRVVTSGTEVEYLFGEESVLIEARHLVNGVSASRSNREPVLEMYHIALDRHEVLSVSGASCESLFLGRLAQSEDILASTMLCDTNPDNLPIHNGLVRPALKPFEAATLVSRLP